MTIPVPVLDDRTYAQLVAEARARVPVHTPEWTNLNENDPGVTLLELFAFLTDNLLYRSNRIPEASRLKFLSMLGIGLQPASPGVGLVTISNEKASSLGPRAVPAGTELTAGQVRFVTDTELAVLPVTAAVFSKQPLQLTDAARARYELLYQTFLTGDTDELSFYKPVPLDAPATGKPDPVVDLGDQVEGTVDRSLWVALLARKDVGVDAVRQAIGGQTLALGVFPTAQVPGQVVLPEHTGTPSTDPGLVVEVAAPAVQGDPADGLGTGPASYRRLPVTYAEPVLDAPGLIHVTLPPYEQLLRWDFDPEEEGTGDYPPRLDDPQLSSRLVTWLRLRYPDSTGSTGSTASGGDAVGRTTESATLPGRVTWVGVNATRVVQAVAVVQEPLGLATGTPYQVATLAHTPVLVTALPAAADNPVTVEVQDQGGTWQTWDEIDDILAAGPDEQVYTLDPAAGTITFGSGLHGLRPVRGARIRASYWYGGGIQGQVAIGTINKAAGLPGGFTVTNPLPTWGAGAGESVADGEAAITRWLRHRDRLVTADDFRDLTRRTPGIDLGRVEVLPLFNPDATGDWPGMVTVLVVPRTDPAHPRTPMPDRQCLDAVCGWLAPRRLVTTELHVRGPVYVPVWVSIAVVALPGHVPSVVNQAVTNAVDAFLSPLDGGLPSEPAEGGLVGGAAATGGGWPLGVSLRPQDVEAVATRVPGVRYVDAVRLATLADSGEVVEVDTIGLDGLQLPQAIVHCSTPPAPDPVTLLAGSRPTAATLVAVPVVPETC